MSFPDVVLPLAIELNLNGTWTSILTRPVYRRSMIQISRGRSDESGTVDRSTCRFELNNRTGDFSPRNPTSPYYGILGRNTAVRLAVDGPTAYLEFHGAAGDTCTTPDAAALDITGDIDLRADVYLDDWRNGVDFLGKWTHTSNQRSYRYGLTATGLPFIAWSTAGSDTLSAIGATVIPAPATGRQCVRATLDVNNGASGNTATFYVSDSMSGPWLQVGAAVVTGGTTSIFASTAILQCGDVTDSTLYGVSGRIFSVSVRTGIDGTEVANPVFTSQTVGASSFADAAGRTWTLAGAARITKRRYRFCGEVSAWPPRWDKTGTDVYVPVEASGVLRRIGQGDQINGSVFYRALIRDTAPPVAYWPCEDLAGSTSLASALSSHGPMSIVGTPTLGGFTACEASDPIPVLAGAQFTGVAPKYTDTNATQIRLLVNIPAAGDVDGQTLLMFYTTGTARRWEVFYGSGSSGTLGIRAFDGDGTQLFTSGALNYLANGKLQRISVDLTQSGADILYNLTNLQIGQVTGLTSGGTLAANTVGTVGTVVISPSGGLLTTAVGHVSVNTAVTSIFDLASQTNAWRGEAAANRIKRLCSEEGINFQCTGDSYTSQLMGAQLPGTLLALLAQCADTDGGILYETRDEIGIGYRTRESVQNQAGRVALDYATFDLAGSLDPTDDDLLTRNDVTVNRPNGSSARATLDIGTLSTLAPPNGVGRYATSTDVNVEFDGLLPDHANWRLHVGTVDEARFPQITVDLSRDPITADTTLTDALLLAEVGDRLTISNPPTWVGPDQISQLIQGQTETLGNYEHSITFNCAPESPYRVAAYGTGNLVTNGHFETDTTGWTATTNTTIARTTAQDYAGSASLSITRAAANGSPFPYGATAATIAGTGTSGMVVTISCYLRIPSAVLSGITGVRCSGTGVATTAMLTATGATLPAADTWTRFSATVGLSADVDDVVIQVTTNNSHANSTLLAYFDAVQIRNVATEDLVDRYQPVASTINEDLTTTETDVDVATSTGPVWTTDDDEFPFDIMIGGERMTVTDISGSSSPQTFTVIRSINGVIKTHTTGATVRIYRRSVYAL